MHSTDKLIKKREKAFHMQWLTRSIPCDIATQDRIVKTSSIEKSEKIDYRPNSLVALQLSGHRGNDRKAEKHGNLSPIEFKTS